MISPETRLSKNPQVVARELGESEGGVLLHLDSGRYHGINPVGLTIWGLIEEGCTVADLVDRLRDLVEDPPPSLETDVLEFLASVHERDLVIVEQ